MRVNIIGASIASGGRRASQRRRVVVVDAIITFRLSSKAVWSGSEPLCAMARTNQA